MISVSQELIPVLSSEDKSILSAVLDENASLDVVVPGTMDGDTLWKSLEACCRVASHITKASQKIKPVIGRLLVVLKDHPEVYQSRGYRTYENFLSRGLDDLFGISRTEAYALRKVAEKFPSLSVAQFQAIGTTKLYAMAAAIGEGEPGCEAVIEKALQPQTTKEQLREFIAEVKYEDAGERQLTDLTITFTKADAAALKQFLNAPETTAYVGTEAWGTKIMRMMAECAGEWQIYGGDLLKAQAEVAAE